eukprot:9435290-Alexandrium_andersonii.AAC.1
MEQPLLWAVGFPSPGAPLPLGRQTAWLAARASLYLAARCIPGHEHFRARSLGALWRLARAADPLPRRPTWADLCEGVTLGD